jgi:putative ABC transport system permease protein
MFKNNFKIIIRSCFKNKLYTATNIIGLSVGLLSFIVVFTVILDELSYDKHWPNSQSLFKAHNTSVINNVEYQQSFTSIGLANSILADFPEVQAYSRIIKQEVAFQNPHFANEHIQVNLLRADTAFEKMFSLETISGSILPYTNGVNNLVITESFRNKYFKELDPVGMVLNDVPKWSNKSTQYQIKAVIKDIPSNTHLRTEVILLQPPSAITLSSDQRFISQIIYYQLKPATDLASFTKKVNNYFSEKTAITTKEFYHTFQPIEKVYLNSDADETATIKSNKSNLYILGIVGIFMLTIACINFINLSTAKIFQRTKETGIRKILGAGRKQLIQQYLLESVLFFAAAITISIAGYLYLLPTIEGFIEHSLTITLFSNLHLLAVVVAATIVLSMLIGIYPAWVISGVTPSQSLKNKFFKNNLWKGESLRKSLVVTQFSLTIIVIISLTVINSQLSLINNKDLGYEKDDILMINEIGWGDQYAEFKNELLNVPGIKHVGTSVWGPNNKSAGRITMKSLINPAETIALDVVVANLDFAEAIGAKLIKGRLSNETFGIDRNVTSDNKALLNQSDDQKEKKSSTPHQENILITRSTAKILGVTEVDQLITGTDYNPVGIIEDLHLESLHKAITPSIILLDPSFSSNVFVRAETGKVHQTAAAIQKIAAGMFPEKVIETNYLKDKVDQLYKAEDKQQTLIILFSVVMLLLSCLGVLGMIINQTEQRVKEIGIRKVLGASVQNIVKILSVDFIKLVFIAVVIASPIAWWAMQQWLNNFAYKTSIQWWMFALGGSIALALTLVTVSAQTIKTAIANPIKSLRDE